MFEDNIERAAADCERENNGAKKFYFLFPRLSSSLSCLEAKAININGVY